MAQVANFPMSLGNFINYTPSTKEQYSAMGVSIVVNFTGIKETEVSLMEVQELESFKVFMEQATRALEEIMFNTAPVDTGKYRDSIFVEFNEQTGEGELSIHNVPYAKFLLYGSKTLFHAATEGNRRGIHWPYTRTEGNMGILHDVRRILYAWEHIFDIALNDVDFAQPRNRLGQFSFGKL